MSRQIIEAFPMEIKRIDRTLPHLNVAEFFTDTIQGEGVSAGIPATFLRLKDCTLNCTWCDSTEVWKKGNPYLIEELVDLIDEKTLNQLFAPLHHHLVLTGGSPLKQQDSLVLFLDALVKKTSLEHSYMFVEIENECVLMPSIQMVEHVSQWNNSPKLSNSGMKREHRYKPNVIEATAKLAFSWFKFVVSCESDWEEIFEDFLAPQLIKREQIILMPCGSNQEQLKVSRELVADIAIRENVRFSDRLHITLWDKKTGV